MKVSFNISELKDKKLFVATPMYGGMCNGTYTKSILELGMFLSSKGLTLDVYYLSNESLIQRARNYCVDTFLRSDCTHMLFIDSDIGFNYIDVLYMLYLCDEDSDYDIVCAPYPKKSLSTEKMKNAILSGFCEDHKDLENYVGDYAFNLTKGTTSFNISEPVEVLESGTGFMMINRSVFERYSKKFPDRYYYPDHFRDENFDGSRKIYAYFDCKIDRGYDENDVNKLISLLGSDEIDKAISLSKEIVKNKEESNRRFLSEDYYFCQESRKAGIKTWLCPWIKLTHTGSYTFKGSLEHLAQIGATPTADINSK